MKSTLSFTATALAIALLAMPLASPTLAAEAKPGMINVSGTADAASKPDLAILNLSVRRQARTAAEALSANNAAMGQVLQAMEDMGVAERDLQTSNFSIQPIYTQIKKANNRTEHEITGYAVTNGLTVRWRDIARVGEALDLSVRLGVNQGGSISFSVDDPSALLEEARQKAVQNAMAKARTLAESAGATVGRIVQISEGGGYRPQPKAFARARVASMEADAVPVASGESTYSVTVNLQVEIAQ